MGFTSPQERQARRQQERIGAMADRRGRGEARSRFREIQPFFEGARADMDALIPVLSQILDTQTVGVGQTLGESLSASGVARGHDRGRAFTAEMAPLFGAHQQARAQLGQARAGTRLAEGQTLMDLFGREDQMIANLLGLQTGAIGMMKDTGWMDDAMAVTALIAELAKSAAPGGIPGLGGGGQ